MFLNEEKKKMVSFFKRESFKFYCQYSTFQESLENDFYENGQPNGGLTKVPIGQLIKM